VANKIKVHCWRLTKNGLAVGEELRRRKIKEGVRCIVCNREETLMHRFWLCPHSMQVWEQLRSSTGLRLASPPADVRTHSELQRWLLDWFGALPGDELGVVLTALYHLWITRNNARDVPMIEHPDSTAHRVVALVEEWHNLKVTKPKQQVRAEEHWLPPGAGWHKANADGALVISDGVGGGGVVIRDHHGEATAGASCFFPHVSDPERAELLACRRAALLAMEVGVTKLVLETDCAGAVAKLKTDGLERSVHGPLVEEIKQLLKGFDDFSVVHVRRTGNVVAHSLAKEGCKNKSTLSWVGVLPEFVMNLMAVDAGV
jgi:ribonuclease HI